MPWGAIFAALSAAAAGSGAGLAIDQAVTAPKAPTSTSAITPTPTQATPTAAQTSAGNTSISNINAATGGGVSPDYWLSQLQQLGLSSPVAQQIANQFIGLNSPGTSAFVPPEPGATSAGSGVVNSNINDLYTGMGLSA